MSNEQTEKHVLSISGGKDSTAMWLLSRERGIETQRVFADTGNEHPLTLEYLEYLESELGPIQRVRADFARRLEVRRRNLPQVWGEQGISDSQIKSAMELLYSTGVPFLDLCLLKGRFPTTFRRFCSQDLKGTPIRAQVFGPLQDAGYTVISWQGVRAEESKKRSTLEVVEVRDEIIIYRPLILWTAKQVFEMHRKHGVKWNPLYEKGMSRVGCMPCIHCKKTELMEIARRYPEEIERIKQWERLVSRVSKNNAATFFAYNKIPRNTHDQQDCKKGINIDLVVDWSKTARGGTQYDLFSANKAGEECSSIYGLCE